jgi:hypothetical protein
VCISFEVLVCERVGRDAVCQLIDEGVTEMIENISYKMSENSELAQIAACFIDTFVNRGGYDDGNG